MHGTWLFAIVVNNMQPDVRWDGREMDKGKWHRRVCY